MKTNNSQVLSLILAILGGAFTGAAGHLASNYITKQQTERTIRKMAEEGIPVNIKNVEEV
jgi:hypothetical protein